MTNVLVYDTEATALEQKANELGTSIAEIIEQLCDFLDEVE